MARPKEVIDASLADKAAASLRELPKSHICIRLQAIISSARFPINLVSAIFGTHRTTVWRWIKRFAARGVDGLMDEPKGHYRSKLQEGQRQRIIQWLEQGRDSQGQPTYWTLSKLVQEIEAEFGIKISQPAIWKLLRQSGFRQKVPRPRHTKADISVQESFKKNT